MNFKTELKVARSLNYLAATYSCTAFTKTDCHCHNNFCSVKCYVEFKKVRKDGLPVRWLTLSNPFPYMPF